MCRLDRLVVLPFALSIVACNNHDNSIPLSQLRSAVADAECERYVRCGYYPDAATCKATFVWAHDLVAAANAGIIRYDGKAEAACLDFIRERGCNCTDEYAVEPASCKSAFQGTRQMGEACTFDQECESAQCDRISCSELCCTGTCREPYVTVAVGGDCSGGVARCADGAFCV
jgi:hypothetical protein